MKFNAKFIDTALRKYYDNQALYMVSNIYAFHSRYQETDFLVVKANNRYCYDIEVKVSVSDFRADFKKTQKHDILEKGGYKAKHVTFKTVKGKRKKYPAGRMIKVNERPNRFYFAVPEGLIKAEDVPDYAGLLYVSKTGIVTKIKESKILHKKKLNIEKMLCRKFYFYWLNALDAVEIVKKALKTCERQIK
jgi:hypothetical protein